MHVFVPQHFWEIRFQVAGVATVPPTLVLVSGCLPAGYPVHFWQILCSLSVLDGDHSIVSHCALAALTIFFCQDSHQVASFSLCGRSHHLLFLSRQVLFFLPLVLPLVQPCSCHCPSPCGVLPPGHSSTRLEAVASSPGTASKC